jgi:hypothetical protein
MKSLKSVTKFLSHSAFTLASLAVAAIPANALNVTTSNDANALVNALLGQGITVVGTPTYTGRPIASGFFNNGLSAGIGIDSGIILTTGDARLAVGPNNRTNAGFPEQGDFSIDPEPGDLDLDSLLPDLDSIPLVGRTQDAAILEFDFISETTDLFFRYVFASEEYPEFVGAGVNDVFGFFVNGQNIALIPGTNTPVAIDNVNGSTPEFFVDNDEGVFNNNIQYDGWTRVFTAQATGLAPGSTNTIKIAIADVGDPFLDSAVFIEGGTFAATPTDPVTAPPTSSVPEPTTILGLLAIGAFGVSAGYKRKQQKAIAKV